MLAWTKRAACASAIALGMVTACDDVSAPSLTDGGVSAPTVEAGPLCPPDIVVGEGCPAEGTTCLPGECAPSFLLCNAGSWREVPRVLGFVCPTAIPVEGHACPTCWPKSRRCAYGTIGCGPGQKYTLATCDKKWSLVVAACPEADGGVPEGGAGADGGEGGSALSDAKIADVRDGG